MDSFKAIPIREITMKNGINIGGFQYRTYQNGPQWDLHLHPIGGFVSLTFKDTSTTYYVSLSQVEMVEGFVFGGPRQVDNGVQAVNQYLTESQGLVPNQHRISVPDAPIRQVDSATDLGGPSESDKRAKDAHFGTKASEPVSPSPPKLEPKSHSITNEPVKKKRGRPRKIRIEAAETLS